MRKGELMSEWADPPRNFHVGFNYNRQKISYVLDLAFTHFYAV